MKKYIIELSPEQREQLEKQVKKGVAPARQIMHAQVLLKTDQGEQGPGWSDVQIQEAFGVGEATIWRIRKRFVEEGLTDAITRRPQPERPEKRKITGVAEAHLIAQTCQPAPAGYANWSVRLLADRFVILETGEKVSRETIRRALKKTNSSRGKTKNGFSQRPETGNS